MTILSTIVFAVVLIIALFVVYTVFHNHMVDLKRWHELLRTDVQAVSADVKALRSRVQATIASAEANSAKSPTAVAGATGTAAARP